MRASKWATKQAAMIPEKINEEGEKNGACFPSNHQAFFPNNV
jgi:hypothetical protein